MTGDMSKLENIAVHGGIDEALGQLRQVASNENCGDVIQELDSIGSTYHLMKQYMMSPAEDAQRGRIYNSLKVRLFEVFSKLLSIVTVRNNSTLRSIKKQRETHPATLEETRKKLEWIAQELVVNSLSGENSGKMRELHQELFDCRQNLFNSLVLPGLISQSEEETIFAFLSSPYVDIANARIAISALMLSQSFVFDIRKFRILARLYGESTNGEIRQYALVAFILGRPGQSASEIYKNEIDETFKSLASLPDVRDDLAELQMQIILCTDTEKTKDTINREIMPALRDSAMQMNGMKSEKEMLDELLHPDKEDSNMAKVEKSVGMIRDMQKKGADIFFGGFSQAKRFSFFYTLMNWFVPFYIEHPQIASINIGEMPRKAINKLLDAQPFCNSDKYSFYLTLSMVHSQIPKEVVEVISKGEAVPEFSCDFVRDNSFVRLMYLQDLYRFYKLFSNKDDFTDPFRSDLSATFFNWDKIVELFHDTAYPFKIARQLLNRNYFSSLSLLLDNNRNEFDNSYLKLRALAEYKQGNYNSSLYWFEKAQSLEPDNILLLKRTADAAFRAGDLGKAEELYEDCISKSAESDDMDEENYRLALCHLNHGKTESARQMLFKLYFNHEENSSYKSALALIYIKDGEYEKAVTMYGNIKEDELGLQDKIRKATALWICNRKSEALEEYRKYVSSDEIQQKDLHAMMKKEQTACGFPLGDIEMKVIADIVYDKTIN